MHYWNTGNTRCKSPYQEEPSINNATPGKDCQAERDGGCATAFKSTGDMAMRLSPRSFFNFYGGFFLDSDSSINDSCNDD